MKNVFTKRSILAFCEKGGPLGGAQGRPKGYKGALLRIMPG